MGKTTITAPEGTPFIEMQRDFDAPRELLYRAYSDPALVVQWLGPRKYEATIDRWDFRDGGAYRYVHSDGQNAYAFRGVFHSVDIDNMVQTFEFEGLPGHVSLDAQTFEDLGSGRTRVKVRSVFQSVEDRDGMVQAGMSDGVEDGYNRLDELLERLTVPAGA
jgi:uncharacterized protein YndB with AHSA1/START domain